MEKHGTQSMAFTLAWCKVIVRMRTPDDIPCALRTTVLAWPWLVSILVEYLRMMMPFTWMSAFHNDGTVSRSWLGTHTAVYPPSTLYHNHQQARLCEHNSHIRACFTHRNGSMVMSRHYSRGQPSSQRLTSSRQSALPTYSSLSRHSSLSDTANLADGLWRTSRQPSEQLASTTPPGNRSPSIFCTWTLIWWRCWWRPAMQSPKAYIIEERKKKGGGPRMGFSPPPSSPNREVVIGYGGPL